MIDFGRWAVSALRRLDPERAHRTTLWALRHGIVPRPRLVADAALGIRLFGLDFPNPIGLAAGFDKNAEVFDAMLRLGFGFVEIGTVTPRPQPGNPRPRLFRLAEDGALINRLGFNNTGLASAAARLAARRPGGIVGANLGMNKDSVDAAADYAAGVGTLAPLVDYLVVNVSSPNTPGLRALQGRAPLDHLLTTVIAARDRAGHGRRPPILLKIAPDLESEQCRDIATLVLAHGVDGLVVGNTTTSRPACLRSRHRSQAGGLSGRPLLPLATARLAEMYRLTGGRVPIVGVGGVASGADAYGKIRAGASLVQLYTALVYAGPALVARIAGELAALLRRDGFKHLSESVGADHR